MACQGIADIPGAERPAGQPSAPSADCRTVVHSLGETEICGQPQRVVVLGPYLLEQVLALGAQPAGYGDHMVLHQGDYTDPARQIPYLGDRVTTQPVNVGLAYQPSMEAILGVQPDLILSPDYNAGQYATLSGIAPTLVFDMTGGQTHLQEIGQALNQGDRAQSLIAATENRVKAAQAEFAAVVAEHPNVLMLTSGEGQTFNLISHSNSFCGALVNDLGFQLIYPSGLQEAELRTPAAVSLEALPELNGADSIILLGFNWDSPMQSTAGAEFTNHQLNRLKQDWANNAIAQSLNATQAGRVYFIPAYLCLGFPGPIGTELYLNELKTQLLAPSEPHNP
ncbi:iron-siderophore ABC transporter substrate-binding protein [Leptolyngbya sp. KIOST-1]|uniref:ABC transporter substrate-binding protein n=1 Tax=Leptolyngbya sp. KIOST-1 TaxID=1229172 RepID=UPI000A43EB55|nr:iron-siderophore ABC transporter substrate-binding protein [Leptolyngbya sp. KIOST-1]